MARCIVTAPEDFASASFENLHDAEGWECLSAPDMPRALTLVEQSSECTVVLYRRELPPPVMAKAADTVRREGLNASLICVVDDGDDEAAARALRDGASDYLFAEQLQSPHLAAILNAALERWSLRNRERHIQQELEQHSSELLAVNALANAVSSSLDPDVIIRRALWVFAGLCQQGGVALVQLDPPPTFSSLEGLLDTPASPRLISEYEFSADGAPICEDPNWTDSWESVIYEDEIRVLEPPISIEQYPGLEPIAERVGENGSILLLPVRSNNRPVGALVLCELNNARRQRSLTTEGLRSMAAQFGSAVDNANLFVEIEDAYQSLQRTQDQLIHAEKFAAVGLLSAELAHELNNPASFVISNLSVMLDYVEDLAAFLDELHEYFETLDESRRAKLQELTSEHEISFLKEDLQALLSRSLSGMQRIHQSVQDLRFFAHDSHRTPGWLDLERLLDATINLIRNEAKFRAQLELDYDDIPHVMSDANRLSQVFLNLLVNAVQAIEPGDVDSNHIRIRTRSRDSEVVVEIEDTGCGMSDEVRQRIFEPFFTTKEPGEGTGMGLAITRDIVRTLGGEITIDSEEGSGTVCRVALPIRAAQFQEDDSIADSGYYEKPPGLDEMSNDLFD